jgi:tRNA/tmRNA/rRNA uracil-C5-methylase (TrmA/RlmC/RlmD family)
MAKDVRASLQVGDKIRVHIEKIAHGGHFIVRHEGAVIFVRHGIPGEEVLIEITSVGSSFNRADVIEVIAPSPDRVSAPCVYAKRDGCGGCDFQHISLPRQRSLKSEVLNEQFARIAKLEVDIEVEEVSGPLGWRTRFNAVTTRNGALGFYAARSHKVIPVDDCRVLVKEANFPDLSKRRWKGDLRVEVAISNTGERTIASANSREDGPASVIEGPEISHYKVGRQTLEVSQRSFWQSNEASPKVLIGAVLEQISPKGDEHFLDLYGGVGLFTSALAEKIGAQVKVDLVEGSKSATADAARNFAEFANVTIHTGDVSRILPRFSSADVIILDPPREGAGREVVAQMVALNPRAILYVACDPAALARDASYLIQSGYSMNAIRAYDLFPMTHHIESVALFEPSKVS